MLSYNKKIGGGPSQAIQMANFNIEPDVPPILLNSRPKMFQSKSHADVSAHFSGDWTSLKPARRTVRSQSNDLRKTMSSLELNRQKEIDSFEGYSLSNTTISAAESTLDLVESLPRMTAVKHGKVC